MDIKKVPSQTKNCVECMEYRIGYCSKFKTEINNPFIKHCMLTTVTNGDGIKSRLLVPIELDEMIE